MVDLKLHHFTHDQIGETLLYNIINFVEKCIQQPFYFIYNQGLQAFISGLYLGVTFPWYMYYILTLDILTDRRAAPPVFQLCFEWQ